MPLLPPPPDSPFFTSHDLSQATALLHTLLQEQGRSGKSAWDFSSGLRRLPAYAQVAGLPPGPRLALAGLAVAAYKEAYRQHRRRYPQREGDYFYDDETKLEMELLRDLLALPADFEPLAYIQLLHSYLPTEGESRDWDAHRFPVAATLERMLEQVRQQGLTPAVRAALHALAEAPAFYASHNALAQWAALRPLRQLLAFDAAQPALPISRQDGFGRLLADFAATEAGTAYQPLLTLWATATGAKPSARFLRLAQQQVQALGPAAVAAQLRHWLTFLAAKEWEDYSRETTYGGRRYYLSLSWFLDDPNLPLARGLVWTLLALGPPAELLPLLGQLAARCYRKQPGVGPWCLSLGNACAWVLSRAGLPGAAQLGPLRQQNRNGSIQKVLDQRLADVAAALNLTLADLEDLAVPTHGLVAGRVRYAIGDYYADLTLATPTKLETHWFRANGTPLKTAPSALKKARPDQVKAVQLLATQAQHTLTAQRERLERAYLDDRSWSYERLLGGYLHHELLAPLAQHLIWWFTLPGEAPPVAALWRNGAWLDATGQPVPAVATATRVQLWHPVLAPTAEVLAWRALLEQYQLRQPFKQAFREVYVLAPAEERTGTYSNRMAAHILRQHQFAALAKQRGWLYRLMGGFDHGSEGATLEVPAHGLRAVLHASEPNPEAATTDYGLYQYVRTDQLRFTRRHHPLPLAEVPALVFSEVMRDADLFVGVTSVANDPSWRDGGPQHRDYWQSYGFGELGELAKTRRLALERLLPRLQLGQASEIRDKFLVVKGKRRTYKIHLGSGNILMEPDDQYLCIVPDRSAKAPTADVFLPFEGDAVLSIILSKALLLMNDDKITDETILRQLQR